MEQEVLHRHAEIFDHPVVINFPAGHTQNERMELINQIVYNLNRYTTERVNYQGAHT